jgi:hypothetical protein
VEVYRLSGKDEADTKRMLDELAQKGTPWPGAPAQVPAPKGLGDLGELLPDAIFPDEWTMPDDWRLPETATLENHPLKPLGAEPAYPKELADLPAFEAPPRPPSIPKVFVPAPQGGSASGEQLAASETGGSHE